MNIDFKLPELGENVENGDIVNVLVREGDVIAANDGVLEMETDKAVVEIPCPYAGKVAKIHVKKGQTVKVGQTLLTIQSESETPAASPPPKSARPAVVPQEAAKPLPEATPGVSKSSAPPPSSVGAAVVLPHPEKSSGGTTAAEEIIPAGPAARRLARELGLDLRQVPGTGARGQITPEDVKTAAAPQAQPSTAGLSSSAAQRPGATAGLSSSAAQRVIPPGEPGTDVWGQIRREKMPKIRRTIAAQTAKSASTIPHVTNFDDADITDLEHLRKNIPQGYIGAGVKLTAMPFVLKAVAMALQQHPTLNASIDDEKEEVIYKEYINIGIAVDTPRGLVVPALRKIDRLGIPQIAQQLNTLAQKARSVAFSVDDLRGATFTVSNMGAIGGTYSTPIINHPEVAVLLLGRSRWMPVVRDEKIEPRFMLPLSLSFDHRLVDGATAARFLNDVIDLLQNPGKLLLTS
ncbi:MAG: 2-oxo acid dehydrogenase subunit E2 [Thermoguttaceae bacterium]|jgi:pyruvate dehydrogenase E2 component (dihydrolipoamide acetyltransferase)